MGVPVFGTQHVRSAVPPGEAVTTVADAFREHERGNWVMPPKVYVDAPPGGDFRAMPASGAGYAVLKWVTSFPQNPARGLPTVSGLVVLSSAETGELVALLDAAAVTAVRTGAAAVLAAETLGRQDAGAAAVIGCGVNGRAAAATFLDRGREVVLHDVRHAQAEAVAAALGERASAAASLDEALKYDLVVTVTPAHEPILGPGSLRPGQHVSLMGADGPGKAEIAVDELLRCRIVCDEWAQAAKSGDSARAVAAGRLGREDVVELGAVLLGRQEGRRSREEITAFDSTGLAVQDLAVALAVLERWRRDPGDPAFDGVAELDL